MNLNKASLLFVTPRQALFLRGSCRKGAEAIEDFAKAGQTKWDGQWNSLGKWG